jgi:AcrR family transcriptional regulator
MPTGTREAPLTRHEIIEAAMALTQEHGLDRLTMRSVGAKLGVSAMALYHHVDDKEQLISLVAEAVFNGTEPLYLGDDGWENGLRRTLLSIWEQMASYPGVGAYFIGQPLMGSTPQGMSRGLEFFQQVGFSRRRARLAWVFALTYIHGRLSVEARLREADDLFMRVQGLRSRDYVEFGVDAVVAGLRTLLMESGN